MRSAASSRARTRPWIAACSGFPIENDARGSDREGRRLLGDDEDLLEDLRQARRLEREERRRPVRQLRLGPPHPPRGAAREDRGRHRDAHGGSVPVYFESPPRMSGRPLRVADDDDLRVRAHRQLLGRLDALPLQELRARCPARRSSGSRRCPGPRCASSRPPADSFWRTNFICSASCSRFSFSWIALATIGGRPILRSSTASVMIAPAARHLLEELEGLPRDLLALGRVQRLGLVGGRDLADRRAHLGMHRDLLVVLPDRLVDVGRLRRVEAEEERALEVHHQALLGGHLGRLLDFLRLDRHLDDAREGKDEVDARRQDVRGHVAEQVLHADVARGHDRDRPPDDDQHEDDEGDDRVADEAGARARGRNDLEGLVHAFSWLRAGSGRGWPRRA